MSSARVKEYSQLHAKPCAYICKSWPLQFLKQVVAMPVILILQLKDFGMIDNGAPAEAQKMKELLMIIEHSVDLVLRTGGVEVRS